MRDISRRIFITALFLSRIATESKQRVRKAFTTVTDSSYHHTCAPRPPYTKFFDTMWEGKEAGHLCSPDYGTLQARLTPCDSDAISEAIAKQVANQGSSNMNEDKKNEHKYSPPVSNAFHLSFVFIICYISQHRCKVTVIKICHGELDKDATSGNWKREPGRDHWKSALCILDRVVPAANLGALSTRMGIKVYEIDNKTLVQKQATSSPENMFTNTA
jgi:hypothetical protein